MDSEMINDIEEAAEGMAEWHSMETEVISCDKDRIHLLLGSPPKVAPGPIVQIFESITAGEIFRGRHQ
jgi:REP element-mobilizing transposase RayT